MPRNKLLSFIANKFGLKKDVEIEMETIKEVDCFTEVPFSEMSNCAVENWNLSPKNLFESLMAGLLIAAVLLKIIGYITSSFKADFTYHIFLKEKKPESVASLERMYLPVFWLLRFAFWMSGAFFYAVYASKSFDGESATPETIRQIFLAGFVIAALLLPLIGRSADQFGRAKGTMVAAAAYGLGALSTQSSSLMVLMVGRGVGGLGTGLMTSISEAWLASATKETKADPYGRWLSKTFATAYSFDSIVAICAGQMASYVARSRGPTGPFEASPLFLTVAVLIVLSFWKENSASQQSEDGEIKRSSVRDSIKTIKSDPKILMVGCIQSLFEAAMYIFVMQWAPALSLAAKDFFGEAASVPFGTVFGCFMACCLLGALLYGELADWCFRTERSTTVMLATATISLAFIGSGSLGLYELVATFFIFEVCAGMYFPAISYLRTKYIPDNNRATIMALFSSAFNLIVAAISLSIAKVGVIGAWSIAASAIALACCCLINLQLIARKEAINNRALVWKRGRAKMMALGRFIKIRSLINDLEKKQKEL